MVASKPRVLGGEISKRAGGAAGLNVCHRGCSLLAYLGAREFNAVLGVSRRGRIVVNLRNCLLCG